MGTIRNHFQPKRIYDPMKADIINAIINEEQRPGERITGMRVLGKKYGISLKSARRGIHELIDEGYLETKGVSGTFIAENQKTLKPDLTGTILMVFGMNPQNKISSAQMKLGALEKLSPLGLKQNILHMDYTKLESDHLKILEDALDDPEVTGILIFRHIDYFLRKMAPYPVVFCNNQIPPSYFPCTAKVETCSKEMAFIATEHLLFSGHKAIGYIGYPLGLDVPQAATGFQAAYHSHGLEFDPDWISEDIKWELKEPEIFRRLKSYFRNHPELTGAYVADDVAFPLVIDALNSIGKKVPDDFSVVTFAHKGNPPIWQKEVSRVEIDFWEIGSNAATLLMQLMQNPEKTNGRFEITKPELICGETVKKR